MPKSSRILALILSISLLGMTGCAYRPPVQQGRILTTADVQKVRRGMTRAQVIDRIGKPVLVNIYPDSRLVYVYTLKPPHKSGQERQVLVYFRSGRVVNFKVFSSPNYAEPN